MQPYVSILVPIYKVPEKFLKQCIESLIGQTLKNIEIIFVDDGSPDDCGKICDEYAIHDSRIKVIHKPNGGLSAARNSAFYAATGEYITFVDGDDYLSPETCEIAYNMAKEKNVQMVFWNSIYEFPNSSVPVICNSRKNQFFDVQGCKELQAKVLDFNGKIAQVFTKMIKRSFLVKNDIIHNEELKQGAEGIIFNILMMEKLSSAYYINECLYHYTFNSSSITHSHNEENYYLIIKCFEYIKQFIKTSKNRDKLEKNLYNRILYVIVTTGISGYFNPENKASYREKVAGYQKFLQLPIIQESLKNADYKGVSLQRKIVLALVRLNILCPIMIMAIIRRKQLSLR